MREGGRENLDEGGGKEKKVFAASFIAIMLGLCRARRGGAVKWNWKKLNKRRVRKTKNTQQQQHTVGVYMTTAGC